MIITNSGAHAMDRISMHVVGLLPKSNKGDECILTFQDLFTKLEIAEPLAQTTAIDISNALFKKIICVFGAPRVILTDQGTNFMIKLMKRVAKRFKIKQVNNTDFHQQTNGSLKRSHSSLIEFFKFFVQKNKSDWDEYIELATFNFNTGISKATWNSPFKLVFRRLARTPGSEPIEKEDLAPTYKGYMETLITRINYLQNLARENLLRAKIR